MGFFDFINESGSGDAYEQVVGAEEDHHKAKLSHELIAAAASYEAAKAYEDHVAKNGQPDSHAKAKEIFAGVAGGFIDRIVETKGLDFIDAQKAKYQAEKQIHDGLYQSGEYEN
ncbi:hypothetical protein AX15_005215 [Amanita polypyramis BW_CC]|nr:hypothetical protein AX15_005215 [Amanita polypyramis BW_CC]